MKIKNSEKRKELWGKNPHCCYCGKLTIFNENPITPYHPLTATIEHLCSKLTNLNKKYSREKRNHITNLSIACYTCNLSQNKKEWIKLGKKRATEIHFRLVQDKNKKRFAQIYKKIKIFIKNPILFKKNDFIEIYYNLKKIFKTFRINKQLKTIIQFNNQYSIKR